MASMQDLLQYSPYFILGFLLLAGGFLMRVLYSYTGLLNQARTLKQAIAGPLKVFKGKEAAAKEAKQEDEGDGRPKPGTWSHRWHRLMVWTGIRTEDEPLILSFMNATERLDRNMGENSRYQLPWYLVVGAVNAGKSQLMEDVQLDLPVGRPELNSAEKNVNWWFFDRGVVLDVNGSYFLNAKNDKSNNFSWARLMHLLVKYRSSRPLDGILLTIPADEVYGKNKLAHAQIVARANAIHTKLWQLQKSLSMRVPVYVAITKTDVVPGFREFANALPDKSQRELLGWSSPYALDAQFSPSWVDDAFAYLRTKLGQVRSEIFQQADIKDGRDGAIVFKSELEKTKESLSTYLQQIFKESSFHDSFFLRGIYFTGDAGDITAVTDHRNSERYFTAPEDIGATNTIPFESNNDRRVSFATDLFEKKMFAEKGVARPVTRILRSTHKWLNVAKVAVAAITIAWGAGLYWEYQRLASGHDSLKAFVEEVDQTLHNIKLRGFDLKRIEDAQYLNEQTKSILGHMTDVNIENSFSVFIPASWFSSYDENVEAAFTASWDEIILKSMFTGLQERARRLFQPSIDDIRESDVAVNPVNKPSFKFLYAYVQDVEALERNIALFNNLEKSKDIDVVGRIILYLFRLDLPARFYENAAYYQSALGRTLDRDINITDFHIPARRKLDMLFDRFLENTFSPSKGTINQTELINALDGMRGIASNVHYDQNELYDNVRAILGVAKVISDPDFKWIERDRFYPEISYANMLNDIANSRILGIEKANVLSKKAQKEFEEYQKDLARLRVPLIGDILAVEDKKALARPSAHYLELIRHFTNFLDQDFMQRIEIPRAVSSIPAGKMLYWDDAVLSKAAAMVDSYDTYIAERIPILTEDLRPILRNISRISLNRHLINLVARAQAFRATPRSVTGFDEQEALQLQVFNAQQVQPHFEKILADHFVGDYSRQTAKLRDVMGDYAYSMLSRIEHILLREDLYGIGQDNLSWWEGTDMIGLRAFGVYDIDGMKSYLAAQRQRATFLAKELAGPVISFLGIKYLSTIHRNMPLRNKWIKIILAIDAYEKQIPGSSLSILENFLLYELNEVGYNNCTEVANFTTPMDRNSDYFLEKRNHLLRALVKRCTNLLKGRGVETYNQLAQFFNRYLAGRFPFTQSATGSYKNEAAPSDVERFLQLYAELGPVERSSIEEYFAFTGAKQSPAEFLAKIDLVLPLLVTALDNGFGDNAAKLEFAVDFRTERNKEAGGDKIIDWEFKVDGAEVDIWDERPAGEWRLGDNVAVSLRWAADGNTVPVYGKTDQSLSVEGKTARFEYKGRWSLVRLLKAHASNITQFGQDTPIVLEFKVPTVWTGKDMEKTSNVKPDRTAKVFLQLSLMTPGEKKDDKEEAKGQKVAFPLFPYNAPLITRGQMK